MIVPGFWHCDSDNANPTNNWLGGGGGTVCVRRVLAINRDGGGVS